MANHPLAGVIVIVGLTMIGAVCCAGVIILAVQGREPPPSLAALAGMVVGALAGILAEPRRVNGGHPK